jgi:hypothetical protein
MSGAFEHPHDHLCANRNISTALFFAACCAIEFLACWRALRNAEVVSSGPFFLFFQAYALFIVGFLFLGFKCVPERIVLGVAILTSARSLIFGLAPRLAQPPRPFVRRIEFALWLAAFGTSLTMLVSALWLRRSLRSN